MLAAITNPNIAFLLMMIGVYGLIFEFMNPSSFLPGTLGAICLLTGLYAFAALPVHCGPIFSKIIAHLLAGRDWIAVGMVEKQAHDTRESRASDRPPILRCCNGKRRTPRARLLHECKPDARSRDATDKELRERRSHGRSVVSLYNTIRPHSSLGYRPPAPETASPPLPPSGSASLHLQPAMATEATMH
jgi:hypothetical protein